MKKHLIAMATAIMFAFLGVASVRAQNAGSFSVTIPFEFVAAGKSLPAGNYLVRRTAERAQIAIEIRSRDDSQSLRLRLHPVRGVDIQDKCMVVFNKYGNQYFLAQVWIAGRVDGDELNKTNREQVVLSEMAKRRLKPETVAVAGKFN